MQIPEARAVTDEQRIRPALSEVRRLCADTRKLQAATGFAPTVTLKEGLRTTIAWLQDPEHLSRLKVDRYNV